MLRPHPGVGREGGRRHLAIAPPPFKTGHEAPFCQDEDAVADAPQLGQVARGEQHGAAIGHERPQAAMDRLLRGGIDAACRFIAEQHTAARAEQAAENHLLLIAPGELADGLLDRGARHPQAGPHPLGRGLLAAAIDPAGGSPTGGRAEQGVDTHRLGEDQAIVPTILRQHADTGADGLTRRPEPPRRTIGDRDRAGRGPIGPEDRPEQFGASGTDEAGKPHHLASPYPEAHLPHPRPAAQAGDIEQDLTGADGLDGSVAGRVATDHLADQPGRGDVATTVLGDDPPVAKHAHPIGDPGQFVEPVGDMHDRNSLGDETAHMVEEDPALRR